MRCGTAEVADRSELVMRRSAPFFGQEITPSSYREFFMTSSQFIAQN